jgi:hypothetical protein
MLIVTDKWYTREMVTENPEKIFVFGDNELRKGMGGQAAACRYKSNTIGIRTKAAPNGSPGSFWYDRDYKAKVKLVDEDFRKVQQALLEGNLVVFPADGFGTGFARLKENAPRILTRITSWIQLLRDTYEIPGNTGGL